jgi:translation initiation factor RLI1
MTTSEVASRLEMGMSLRRRINQTSGGSLSQRLLVMT